MTFDRGASLTTATTLGFSDGADLGPTAGNGFYKRWPDDLAALSDLGLTALRIPLDWARLQPKPGAIDSNWAEWFDHVLVAVDAIGLQPWVTLHEAGIPRWFDNDGGLDDADTFTTWWPRWVERAADRFGDHVHGWIPFASVSPKAPFQAWKDTWGILGGNDHTVVASIDARPGIREVERFLGLADQIGIDLNGVVADLADATTADGHGARGAETVGQAIRDIAERAGSTGIMITAIPTASTPDAAGAIVGDVVATIDDAIADGVAIGAGFVEPAIGVAGDAVGLLDADRAPTPVAEVFQTHPRR